MSQIYHCNAATNIKIRKEIRYSNLSITASAKKHNVTRGTIKKWRARDDFEDKSSRPNNIHYKLNDIEKSIIVSLRISTWMKLDEITDILTPANDNYNRSNIYSTLVKNNISRVPQEKRDEAKKFKEYTPGFIHIDVTYLPKLEGKKKYLFVAIDRATRLLFYKIYPKRMAKATEYKEAYNYNEILTAIRQMLEITIIQKRNKAIVSLNALCGLRISELRTVKIKNLIQEEGKYFIYANPKNMEVKFAKVRNANFMPLPQDIVDNVINWKNYLLKQGFKDKDPLFPIIPNNFNQYNLIESNPKPQEIKSNTTLDFEKDIKEALK